MFENQPVERDILNRASALNLNLDVSELQVTNITDSGATIKVRNDAEIYAPGSLDITFHLGLDLGEDLIYIDLGEFDRKPTMEQILERILELNPNVKLSEINITNISNTHAMVNVNLGSQVYIPGNYKVMFAVHI